jgi:hypothetical protein
LRVRERVREREGQRQRQRQGERERERERERTHFHLVSARPDDLQGHVVDEVLQKVEHSVPQAEGLPHGCPYLELLRLLMILPGPEHTKLHVFAEIEQPRQQLILGESAAAQKQRHRPGHFVVQRQGLYPLEPLRGEGGEAGCVALSLCFVPRQAG